MMGNREKFTSEFLTGELISFPVALRPNPSHGLPSRGFAITLIEHTTVGRTTSRE